MSIAEQIMLGSQQQSKNWSVLSDSIGQLGQQIGQSLANREYQKQSQEMLPFLQQNLQAAMAEAQSGKSGQAYARFLGSLDPQMLKNPEVAPFIKLGFEAIGKSADDYIYSQKNQGSSLADLIIAKNAGLLPSEPQGGGMPPAGNVADAGMGNGENPPPGFEATPVEPNDDITATPPPGPAAPKSDEETMQTAQDIFINTQRQVEQEGTGLALASLNYVDAQELQGKNLKDDFIIVNLPVTASRYLGQGIDKMLVPKSIEGLKQKGLSIRGSMGTINYENDVQDNKTAKELRQRLQSTIDSQISRLDNSAEVQELIEYYGGFDKIPPHITNKATNNLEWRIKGKNGKDKTITLKSVRDKDNPGLAEVFIGVINSPNQAAILGMPMLRSGGADEMPAVGVGKSGQTSVSQKVLNATAQAKRELPGASNDKILERARAIAAAAK